MEKSAKYLQRIILICIVLASLFGFEANTQNIKFNMGGNINNSIKINQIDVDLLDKIVCKNKLSVDSLVVQNYQLDTIFRETIKNLSEKSILSFYVELTGCEEDPYVQIIAFVSNNDIFDILNKYLANQNKHKKSIFMGFTRYENTYFYITSKLSYPKIRYNQLFRFNSYHNLSDCSGLSVQPFFQQWCFFPTDNNLYRAILL